ncbi:MAG TPA: four helix bundle protein [Lacunisphaera sp.]
MMAERETRQAMTPKELQERTMQFAVRVLKLADALPKTVSGRTVANQIARSGCSVAANYRSALRGKSHADFINKITIVLEEADETGFWIELSERAGLLQSKRLRALRDEAEQLTKIFNATRTTARNRKS